jgi:vitamin B12 transporter
MFHWVLSVALAGVAAPVPQQAGATPGDVQAPAQVHQEEIVVTAALEREEREELPVSATVIGRREIRERQATAVYEVLRTVPGLDVAQSGTPGKVVSVFSRGAESNQSLVLWNGLPLNDPFFGGFDWAFLPTDGVGRVEVVRGPFSALYGSDAMGSVVQVLSDRSEGGAVRLEGGSDSYGRLGLAWGEDLGAVRFDVAGHARQGDGAAENDFYDGDDLLGRLEWKLGEDARLGLMARASDNEIGIPVASGVETPRRTQESETLQLAVPFEIELGDWSVEALLSRADREFRFEDPDAAFSLNATDAERSRLRTVVRYRAGGDFWLAGGAEWQEDVVSNRSNFGPNLSDSSRRDWALFAQAQKALGRFRFDLGVRHDDDEYFGGQVTPRAGVVVDLGASWQLFATYAEGFRAPSLGELFFPFFGNPDLEPEESESTEAGVRWDSGSWWAGVAYFDNDFTNLIDGDPVTFTAINVGRATTDGWELEVGYRQGLVEVRANATLLDTRDLDTGLALLRRPEERAGLLVAVRPEPFAVQLTGRWVGERADLDPVTSARVVNDSYAVADLAVTWEAGKWLSPYARVGNLADEEYEEVVGFPAPARTWAAGLEVRWP